MELNNLIKVQMNNKSIIEKARINYKKSPKERITQSYLETRLESLEEQWKHFVVVNSSIVEQATVESENHVYFTTDVYDTTEDSYITYKSELKERLLKYKVNSAPTTSFDKQPKVVSNVKLPKISLPKFSGLYTEWTSFRDLFLSLIHKNEVLDDVQKLHYLKSHLSGEAEQLLRHTPVTASNYEECWSLLTKRYDNKKFLSHSMLKRFVKQPIIVKESATSIKNLLDTTVDCLQGLRTIGINIDSWDMIIIFLISEKLDTESRKLWESMISADDGLPTFSQFKDFLLGRFRSLEFLDKPTQPKRNVNVKTFHIASEKCILCSGDHKLFHCKQFAKQDTDQRREFARSNKLCYNCLGQNHSVHFCRQSTKCKLCKRRHHTLLHPKTTDNTAEPVDNASSTSENVMVAAATATSTHSELPTTFCCFTNMHTQSLLATALVSVETRTGTTMVLRALMDQGSQVSFITEAAVQLLGLKKSPAHADIVRLGDDQGVSMPSKWIVKFKLQSRLDPTFFLNVQAYVLNRLTSHLPERKIIQILPSTFVSLKLADPTYNIPGKIDILLSSCIVGKVLLEGLVRGPPGTPVAQKTKLGWILSGELHTPPSTYAVCYNSVIRDNDNGLLRKFWELESEPSIDKVILTEEEQKCEEFYSNTTIRDAEGRYIVKLPFKTECPTCVYGRSKDIARKRFNMLEHRFMKNPSLQREYSAVIREYIQLGHAEVVPQDELNNKAFYLPHHAVVRDDKTTTKVRVVFDASCSGHEGVSLNDELMVGPTLQPELRQTIMRWRCHPITLVADIVKMYRQVKVADEDIDFQRILWRENPNAELQHLRLLRVTFGVSSAPYLAVRTLQQLARDEGKDFPSVASKIMSSFYVDDYLSGCETVTEGEQMIRQMNELLARGGFQLQKWSSNNEELLNKINSNAEVTKENIEFKVDKIIKILGITWSRSNDVFHYTVHLSTLEAPVTKRKVVSDIARLFDPLGWLAPVIITAKVFIQRLWLSGIEWDDALPNQLLQDWVDYRSNLFHLRDFQMPRWMHTSKLDERQELQGFCDASTTAYAAVVYSRVIDVNGEVHISLVASKTKVAPVKQVSIPRLELCGAVLLSKLLREVAGTLGIEKGYIHAWTDSSVVLAWLSSHPSRWKTFVGNRVSEILSDMDSSQWSHVQSQDNPADCASRGVNPNEFAGLDLWLYGPSWLQNEQIEYSKGVVNPTKLEEKVLNTVCKVTVEGTEDDNFMLKFSSLRRLTRVVAYCRRFLKLGDKSNERLSYSEINQALLSCVKVCQLEYFKDEINSLQKTGIVNKRDKLNTLNPYLDSEGILRVNGRLHRANILYNAKHPIIIPHKSHITTLLIADAHERTLHGGLQLVLNYLRSKYWIINAKAAVRMYIRKCVTCVRYSARVVPPLMGQLPSARVNASRPFSKSGVDYAGPINVRPTKGRGYHATKGYICLFVCMATRAIHLELVSDLTSQAFLAALKRFTARRGHCRELWSDNGTTFVGANKELKSLVTHERLSAAPDVADWLTTNGTKWHFIPPHSPNFGGLWEAGVKSSKHHLRRVVGTSTLTFEEMTTVLTQIEACLNSRPISSLSSNLEDPRPLTPGHFLVGESLLLTPDENFEKSNISTLKRWQLTQRMVQEFWRRWSREYLVQFHQRYKWAYQTVEPKVGDVVLVMEDDLPPARWLYGLIIEKHTGSDKVTRVVSLRCKGSVLKRPVSKLIVLPVTE